MLIGQDRKPSTFRASKKWCSQARQEDWVWSWVDQKYRHLHLNHKILNPDYPACFHILLVKTLVEEENKMEIRSQFWFSNHLVHTVRFDAILPSEVTWGLSKKKLTLILLLAFCTEILMSLFGLNRKKVHSSGDVTDNLHWKHWSLHGILIP